LHINIIEGKWFKKGDIDIGVFNFIPPKLFLSYFENASKIENFIVNFIRTLKHKQSKVFKPLIGTKFFPFGKNLDYRDYLQKNFLFFLNKAQKKGLINDSEGRTLLIYYDNLLQKINKPKIFYFTHNDLSLKHLYWVNKSKRKIGVIDWESSMFLDKNIDYSIWLIRNQDFYFYSNEGKSLALSSISNLDIDSNFLKCHLFREGFIQEYFQKKENLRNFMSKYKFLVKNLKI